VDLSGAPGGRRRPAALLFCALVLPVALGACAASPRAPASWCMQRTVDALALDGLPDARRHCLAAGAIAARCGNVSAMLAGQAKELADLFGPGDASRADLAANAAGRRCGQRSRDPGSIAACCAESGY